MIHEVFGVPLHDMDDSALALLLEAWIQGAEPRIIVTPNPEMMLLARRNASFRDLLNRADLSLPDGVGLRFAVRLLTGRKLLNRHTGVDTLQMIADMCSTSRKKLLLLGAETPSGRESARQLSAAYLNPGIVGQDGLIKPEIISEIEQQRPDVIAVALGQGKQEAAMEQLARAVPSVRILIGVGGAFDMISGRLRRAPVWMRKCGLEWLWRVLIEPSRLPRTLTATVVFPIVVVWAKLRH